MQLHGACCGWSHHRCQFRNHTQFRKLSEARRVTRGGRQADHASALPGHTEKLPPLNGKGPVCIAGGGPAGLAAALMLARRGWKDITIIEKKEMIGAEDNQRSYVYMIDGRGRKLLSRLPGVEDALDEFGVSTAAINIMRVMPDGLVKQSEMAIKDAKRINHFMPRPAFLKLLLEKGLQQDWAQEAKITLLTSTEVEAITRTSAQPQGSHAESELQEPPLRVKAVRRRGNGSHEDIELQPRLLIGADGQSSMVRTTLQQWEKEDSIAAGTELQNDGRFALKEFYSPAAGLRYKILRLPPNPVASSLPDSPPLSNPSFALLIGKAIGAGSALRALRLGLLPQRDPNASRTANLITKPDHKVWEVSSAEDMYSMLQQSMPQVRFRELVPQEVMEQFAASKGGRFPRPQLCDGLQYLVKVGGGSSSSGSSSSSTAVSQGGSDDADSVQSGGGEGCQSDGRVAGLPKVAGVLLIGDARASFPPDLGQGVNSALEDCDELAQVLDQTGDNLEAALPLYEQRRAPHIAALIKLMTFSFPWQYNQDPLQRLLWSINFAIRALLSKVLPAIFSPHSFMLVQVSDLSYKQVLEMTHATTLRLWATLGAVLLGAAAVMAKSMKASTCIA